MTTENSPETAASAMSYEDQIRDEAQKYAQKRNKIRLMKWLAQKDESIRIIESEIKGMIDDCKNGDFTGLPDLTPKEEETLSNYWTTTDNLNVDAASTTIQAIANNII